MEVLLVTGRLEGKHVKNIAAKHGCEVYVAHHDVASLITTDHIIQGLRNKREIKLILVPGLMRGDLKEIEESLGIPTFRGPKDVADLDFVLGNLNKFKFSKKVPADEILQAELKRKALRDIAKIDAKNHRNALLKRRGNILIGELGVGWDFPQRVVAEIVGADDLTLEEILIQGKYFLESGADIIDIGMSGANSRRVEEAIEILKPLGAPLSLDSMEYDNIERAIERGVDMVMSFDEELIKRFQNIKTPSVIVPKLGRMPAKPLDRIKLLEKNIELAKRRGFKKIIADPILMPPPNLMTSLVAYKEFSMRHPHEYPILMGAGNVTELIDADSVGINALLCELGSECSASLIFTAEASDKTRGSVGELQVAAKMMYLSKIRGSPPKDLGFELLRFKEKRIRRDVYEEGADSREMRAAPRRRYKKDPLGYFRIFVERKRIRCVHYHKGGAGISIVGTNAGEISDTAMSMGLLSSLEHASYLGRELQKAEFALKYGKSYVQD